LSSTSHQVEGVGITAFGADDFTSDLFSTFFSFIGSDFILISEFLVLFSKFQSSDFFLLFHFDQDVEESFFVSSAISSSKLVFTLSKNPIFLF